MATCGSPRLREYDRQNPSGHRCYHRVPRPHHWSGPVGITAGPDGNLWFTESQGNKIGKIVPATGAITEYPVSTTAVSLMVSPRVPMATCGSPSLREIRSAKPNPETGTIVEYELLTPWYSIRHNNRSRWQPVVHRDSGEYDRQNPSGDRCNHRVPRSHRWQLAPLVSPQVPMATCGSPRLRGI